MIGMMADLPVRDTPVITLSRDCSNSTTRGLLVVTRGHRTIFLIWNSIRKEPAKAIRFHTGRPGKTTFPISPLQEGEVSLKLAHQPWALPLTTGRPRLIRYREPSDSLPNRFEASPVTVEIGRASCGARV